MTPFFLSPRRPPRAIWRRPFSVGCAAACAILLWAGDARAQTVAVGGTGGAMGFIRKVGELVMREDPNLSIEVLPSLGSTGGLRALAENAIGLALSGRNLTPEESAAGLSEAQCYETPYVFVTSAVGMTGLSHYQLLSYFSERNPLWPNGTAVRLLLRPSTDSASPYLAQMVPGMAVALGRARERREIPIAASDQDNVEMAAAVPNSLTAAPLVQLITEAPQLTRLTLDGVAGSMESIRNGSYPKGLRFCVIRGRLKSDPVERLLAWLKKPERDEFYTSLGVGRL